MAVGTRPNGSSMWQLHNDFNHIIVNHSGHMRTQSVCPDQESVTLGCSVCKNM